MTIETKESRHWVLSRAYFLDLMVKREAVRVKISKSYLETVVQHLYPFELSCDITRNIDSLTNKVAETADKKMNVE